MPEILPAAPVSDVILDQVRFVLHHAVEHQEVTCPVCQRVQALFAWAMTPYRTEVYKRRKGK
jgi:hypothetical protein